MTADLQEPPTAQRVAPNHRILVIDDNHDVQEDFRKILADHDEDRSELHSAASGFFGDESDLSAPEEGEIRFEIKTALQGVDGVEMARQHKAAGEPFAMAFVDVRMPPGIDGIETVSRIWEFAPELQIVICTAYSDYSWDDMMEKLGRSDRLMILKKPFDSVEVLQLAHALTDKWRLEAQTAAHHDELEENIARRTAELRQSQQQLAMHVERTPVGVIDWDLESRVRSWNPAAEAIFGWPAENAIGYRFAELLQTGGGRRDVASPMKMMGEGYSVIQCRTRAGESIITEWHNTALLDESGKPFGVASLVQDITQRAEAERALRQTEERFSKAFHASPVSICILELPDGRFLDVNDSFCEDFGHEHEAVIDRTAEELSLWGDAELARRLQEETLERGSVRDFECPLLTADGTTRNTLLSAERIQLDERQCLLLQIHDLTERLSLEAQLRQAQKMDGIGQLAAGVAHDFNNILTIIQGHANLLQVTIGEDHEDYESVMEISDAAKRAAELTRQLLAFSRKQVMQSRVLDLNEAVNSSARMLQRMVGETIELRVRLATEPKIVRADVGMIEQVLLNLCVNARDAMPEGGVIDLCTAAAKVTASEAEALTDGEAGEYILLAVKDTGCGMNPQTRERIFEPFFTTKDVGQGTGLGLATVFGIVKQHKGWIDVQTEEGKGTEFRIYLPVCAEDREAVVESAPTVATTRGHEGILVTEDEPALRNMVSLALRHCGYRVFTAGHGREARKVWQEHADEIDLLLTDMVMPEGISGWELAAELSQDRPGLIIIYTSGYSPDLFGKDVALDDNVNFLPKPYEMLALTGLVRAALDGNGSSKILTKERLAATADV